MKIGFVISILMISQTALGAAIGAKECRELCKVYGTDENCMALGKNTAYSMKLFRDIYAKVKSGSEGDIGQRL